MDYNFFDCPFHVFWGFYQERQGLGLSPCEEPSLAFSLLRQRASER